MNNIADVDHTNTILVAENNDLALKNYQEVLSDAGFSVIIARTPHKAHEVLQERAVHLALIDWRLENDEDENDNSGLEIVRRYGHFTPTILMTLLNQDGDSILKSLRPTLNQAAPIHFFRKGNDSLDKLVDDIHAILNKRKVFVVHGHNEQVLGRVTKFLDELSLSAIVLKDQESQSRTIIENLEFYSNVSYAIVLLTGDDEGRIKNDSAELQSRARQNVVFELGLFIGKLGRNRVITLVESGVELPSDWSGVTYIPLNNKWRVQLKKEIRRAGIL